MINNLPVHINEYEYIVAREIDGEYWFWGAYTDGFKAEQVAFEIDGTIFHNVRIQGYKKP